MQTIKYVKYGRSLLVVLDVFVEDFKLATLEGEGEEDDEQGEEEGVNTAYTEHLALLGLDCKQKTKQINNGSTTILTTTTTVTTT